MPPQFFVASDYRKWLDPIEPDQPDQPNYQAPQRQWVDIPDPTASTRQWVDIPDPSSQTLTNVNMSSFFPPKPPEPKQVTKAGGMLDEFLSPDKWYNQPVVDFNPYAEEGAKALKKISPTFSDLMLKMAPFGIGDIVDQYYKSKGETYDPRDVTAGAARKLGEFGTALTTPYNLALLGLTEGASLPEQLGLGAGLGKLMTWGARAGSAPIAAQGVRETTNLATGEEPFTWGKAGGAAANTILGTLGMFQGMPKVKLPGETAIPKVEVPRPKFSPFGEWAEPTQSPKLPGMENVDFNQHYPETQLPLEEAPVEPQGYQMDLPYGARSWGNVPEPRANAEGQYNLFQGNDAAQSYEGVSRQSPFQFGPPPTMEDMAPPSAPPPTEPPTEPPAAAVPPTEPPSPAAPTGTSDIQGVVFQGDNAVLTQPSDVNMALLKQRGYEPSGKLQNGWPVWNKAPDLSESAFTKAMRASIAQQQSAAAPEGMSTRTVGPTDPIILPARLATTDKFLELADQGYEVGAKLPNGDVQMNPIGGRAYSDPFGVGTVVEAARRLGRSEAPKTEVKGGMMSDPFGIGVIGRALRGMRELHNPPDATTGGGPAPERITQADIDATTHVKEMSALDTRLGDEFQRLQAAGNHTAAMESNALRRGLFARYNSMLRDGTLQGSSLTRGGRNAPAPAPPALDVRRVQDAQSLGELNQIRQDIIAARRRAWDAGTTQGMQEVARLDDLYEVIDRRESQIVQPQTPLRGPAPRPKSVIISSNTPTTSVSSRYLDPDTVAQRINSLTTVSEAHQLADEYSRLHGVADRLADKSEANEIKGYYDQVLAKRDQLLHADALGRGERPVSEVMDEFAQRNMSAKNRQRFERKRAKPLSAVASEMKNVPGMERIATTVDPTSVMHYLSHEYAKRELSVIPNGAPGFELVTNVTPRRLGGYGDYRAIYRNPQGKPIVKVDFNVEHGIGKIGSMGYDKDSGLVGRALLKTFKEITPMGVRMPSGSISRHTLNFMDKMGRMVNSAHGGFINLAELFSKNPDNNKPLLNYVKEFFTRQRADGKTVIDKESLAAALKGEDGGTPKKPLLISNKNQPSVAREAYNFARGMTTTMDLSAPLRQGLPLIASKKFWTSLKQMRQALGDEVAFEKTLSDLRKRPLFQRQWNPETGKLTKSFAEVAGIKLSDLHEGLQGREEAVASNWAESGGMLGSDMPFVNRETSLQRGYQKSVGRVTRASNRAYTAFLNQLRADSFESLLKDAHADFKAGTKGSKDPYSDLTYAKEIADYVNTATGRGPLRFTTSGIEGGRLGQGGHLVLKDRSLERLAPTLADIFFSPRLMASRMRMLNPGTYMMATPFVRKQYLKSLFSVAGFAGTMAGLAAGAGANVSLDPNSSDFMKIRIGNTRLDMMGGFQQFVVAASRLITGHDTSSASGKDFETGQGYRPVTRGTIAQNFMTNKLHPIMKFANDMAYASQHQPFAVGDRTLQLFVPLIIGDVMDLAKEDPRLLPLAIPTLFGAGTQTYDKGAPVSKFLPSNLEPWNFTGGGLYR